MPKALNTLCLASRSQIKATTRCSHVWICDDLLADTFRSFAHNHRRHGSNVPGPLEARRRAAKRRATSLAHHSYGGLNVDPVGLMGSQPQFGWWQQTENSLIPGSQQSSWPLGLPHRPPPPPPAIVSDETLDYTLEGIQKSQKSIEIQFQRWLANVKTHDDLLQVLDERSVNLAQNPQLAQRALAQLLSQSWDIEEVQKFLLDPKVNPVGSRNHVFLFKTYRYHGTVLKSLLEQATTVRAAQLGLLTVTDLQAIFRASIRLRPSVYGDSLDSSSFCNSLLDAIENSGVLNLHDLGVDFLSEMLLLVKHHDFHQSTPRLLRRLRQSSHRSEETLLSQVITDSIRMAKTATTAKLGALVDFVLEQPSQYINTAVFEATSDLMTLAGVPDQQPTPTDFGRSDSSFLKMLVAEVSNTAEGLRHSSVPRAKDGVITAPITESRKAEEREAKPLELWYAVLSSIGSHQEKHFNLCTTTFNKFVNCKSQNRQMQKRLMVGLWVAMALSVRDDSSLDQFKNINLGEETFRIFHCESQPGDEDVLATVLDTLQDCPLPAKNKLLQRMRAFTKGYLNTSLSYWDLSAQLTELRSGDVAKLRDEKFYHSAQLHFPVIASKLSQSLNHDLAIFEKLCCEIIRDTKGCINLVQRLLSRNNEIKFSLWYASKVMSWDGSKWQIRTEKASTREALGGYTYTQLIEMFDNIAWECATAKHLSDRSAFRYTHWLCMYLHMHRAPVSSQMLRALWHAGITRNEGHCYKVVGEIYSLVAEYEGYQAAQALLNQAVKGRPVLRAQLNTALENSKHSKSGSARSRSSDQHSRSIEAKILRDKKNKTSLTQPLTLNTPASS